MFLLIVKDLPYTSSHNETTLVYSVYQSAFLLPTHRQPAHAWTPTSAAAVHVFPFAPGSTHHHSALHAHGTVPAKSVSDDAY